MSATFSPHTIRREITQCDAMIADLRSMRDLANEHESAEDVAALDKVIGLYELFRGNYMEKLKEAEKQV